MPHPFIRWRVVGAAAVLVLAGGLLSSPAAAATPPGVPSGQTHHGRLTIRRETAAIAGTVDGDVSVQDHATLTVSGRITGSFRSYGDSTVTVEKGAVIDGSVEESTGTLTIEAGSTLKKQLDTYNLSRPAVVDGRILRAVRVSASGLELGGRGQVDGDLSVWARRPQPVDVDGTVDGSVRVSGTDLHLGSTSHVHGSTHVSGGTVKR